MNTYAVVGLGYVGLSLAIAIGKKLPVLAYDINEDRIHELNRQIDRNKEIDPKDLRDSKAIFTPHLDEIKKANFYFVTVATPAYFYETPNLKPLIKATQSLASILKKDDILVFESTVYPGTTEHICIPILEELSGLSCGKDFHVGYSPERVNPGDKIHDIENTPKIVSAQNEKTLKRIQETYETFCDKVYPVSSIPTAEAVKLLENTQRDINIALMNEFTKIMHALHLDMHEIIEAAKTKWSFIPYKPGFVGGHCISIDPHYLAFEAKRHGVYPDLILTGRKVNDGMTQFVIQSMIQLFIKHNMNVKNLSIGVFGLSYKENVPDIRNSLSLKLIKELKEYGFNCLAHDPFEHEELPKTTPIHFDEMHDLSVAMILVQHQFYKDLGLKNILSKCKKPWVVMDIPNMFIHEHKKYKDLIYWSL